MMQAFIVEIERDVWLADWEGDPSRTLDIRTAKLFKSERAANLALKRARQYRPFINGAVKKLTTTYKPKDGSDNV